MIINLYRFDQTNFKKFKSLLGDQLPRNILFIITSGKQTPFKNATRGGQPAIVIQLKLEKVYELLKIKKPKGGLADLCPDDDNDST